MGKINYSIVPRTVNLAERTLAYKNGKKDSFVPEIKFYAAAQQSDVMTLQKFAEHIAQHHSKYGKGDVYCVLIEMVSCMREQLLLGNRIMLGDLGSFYITLASEGAEYYNEFNTSKIKKINVLWEKGQDFKNLIQDAEFELVETRKNAAANLKATRESYPTRPAEDNNPDDDQTPGLPDPDDTPSGGGQTPSGGGTPSGGDQPSGSDQQGSGGQTSDSETPSSGAMGE